MTVPHAPTINADARLVLDPAAPTEPDPRSWFITHGLGGPAANTYTEVAYAEDALPADLAVEDGELPMILDEVTRRVAGSLYGTSYAFTYRPDQYATAIARYGMTRRELVVVSTIEVYA